MRNPAEVLGRLLELEGPVSVAVLHDYLLDLARHVERQDRALRVLASCNLLSHEGWLPRHLRMVLDGEV